MKKMIGKIGNKIFVSFYVLMGLFSHYFSKMTYKKVTLAIVIITIVASPLFFNKTNRNLKGNDALNNGYDQVNRGNRVKAHEHFHQAYLIFEKQQYSRGVYLSLKLLGDQDVQLKNFNEALTHYDGALRIAQFLKNEKTQIELLKKHAEVKLQLGNVNAARAHYYDAIKISEDIKAFDQAGLIFTNVGNLEREIGNDRRAGFAYRNALKAFEKRQNSQGQANLYWFMGTLDDKLGNIDQALISFENARNIYKSTSNIFNEATVIERIAKIKVENGQKDEAFKYYNEASILFSSIGKTIALERIKQQLNSI